MLLLSVFPHLFHVLMYQNHSLHISLANNFFSWTSCGMRCLISYGCRCAQLHRQNVFLILYHVVYVSKYVCSLWRLYV
jgi:hypothetical protein